METPKQRYDRKYIMRVGCSLHRIRDKESVEKMEELTRSGKSRGEYIREAIKEKVERENSQEGKE